MTKAVNAVLLLAFWKEWFCPIDSKRAAAFKQRLLGMEITTSILSKLGDDGKTTDDLEEELKNYESAATVRTFLSWLETLGVLHLSGQKYIISDEYEEEEVRLMRIKFISEVGN